MKTYTNKRIEAKKSWVLSKVQIRTLKKKKMGFGRTTDLKSYEFKRIETEKSWVLSELQII